MSAPVALQGEAVARLALSAAAQSPTTATLAVLEAIPPGAWDCAEGIGDYAKMLCAGIRAGEAATYAAMVIDEFGYHGDPWSLDEYVDNLTTLFRALKPTVADTPAKPTAAVPAKKTATLVIDNGDGSLTTRSVPVPGEAEEAPRTLPAFTDMSEAWDLADNEIEQGFNEAMPRGELAVIVSMPGEGKSYLALGLGLSIAFGRSMVAGFTPSRPSGRVLFLFGEDGTIPVAQRTRAWCMAHEITRRQYEEAYTGGRLAFMCGDSALLLEAQYGALVRTRAYEDLLALCEVEKYDFIVVDSFAQWSGIPKENENAGMHVAASALIDLARACGGVVLALHHVSKSSAKGEPDLSAVRGGGALGGKMRWGGHLRGFTLADCKDYGLHPSQRKSHLFFEVIKAQYTPQDGARIILERGPGGVLEVVNLHLPKSEDALLALARALATKIGANPQNIPKWSLLQDKPGAEFRREFKAERGAGATKENVVKAYMLAVERGWLVEDASSADGGDNAKIPRIPVAEEVE